MKLLTLKIVARGVNGWESPLLTFGQRTTSLYAPNGSGKTPIVQAVAYCLGYNTKFRSDVLEKCLAVILAFEQNNVVYEVRRDFDTDFFVLREGESSEEYFNERDLSSRLFEILEIDVPVLVSSSRQATQPYISTLLPIFYVKQDGGYVGAYNPPAVFIPDQFVEMIRFAFGLSPKRSYTAKKDLLETKDRLESVQRKIVSQQRVISDLASSVDDSPAEREALSQRAAWMTAQLSDLRETVDAEGAANAALLEILHAKEKQIRAVRRIQSELRARVSGIESIRSEIEGEIKTLSLNEESRRAFETFGDICNRPDCCLFVSSSETYGKNLLYLRDQIKDLESNTSRAEAQLVEIDRRISDDEAERDLIASKIVRPVEATSTSQLVSAVHTLTKELLEIEQRRAVIDELSEQRKKYLKFEDERSRIQDRIATLRDNGRADLEFNKLRNRLRNLVVKWMDILGTPNASRQIDIDLDFKFLFGGDGLDTFTGSTRTRLVLAVHAAIFEEYLKNEQNPFRFIVLDTPKQQELKTEDLEKFLTELQEVCEKNNGQVLISSTEYHHKIEDENKDIEWLPTYPGSVQKMYLGAPQGHK